MARHVNRVTLLGKVFSNPELVHGTTGIPYTRFTLVTIEHYTKKGESIERTMTTYHSILAWDKLSERADSQLTTNSTVYVEGSLQSRLWTSPNGTKHQKMEIRAQVLIPLDKRDMEPQTPKTNESPQ